MPDATTPSDAALRAALKRCLRQRSPRELSRALTNTEAAWLTTSWPFQARDDQLPPDFHHPGARWRVWLYMAGRGAGKTRAGAEWIKSLVASARAPLRIALAGATLHDARSVMVEGVSGLLAVHEADEMPHYEPSRRLLTWANGCKAQLFSADEPAALRGPQFHAAWCDEIAKWRAGIEVWDMLMFALRLGDAPRVMATTTPAPVALVKRLLKEPGVWLSRARTRDNAAHLPADFLSAVREQYAGTRLGRQELDGELLEDAPGALFPREVMERARLRRAPDLIRVVVAVDPPVTGHEKSDACGIIAAGVDAAGHVHVLEDATIEAASPAAWARAAVRCYHRHMADRLVAEVNQGGDMVEAVIRQADGTIAYRPVRATRGKAVRAEPVAALYEQGRVHHIGAFPALEDELCGLERIIASARSPDRADALVWAITDLALTPRPAPRVRLV